MAFFNVVSFNSDVILRGADHQEGLRKDRNLVYEGPTMSTDSYLGEGSSVAEKGGRPEEQARQPAWVGLKIHRFELHNRSGSNISVGIGYRWRNGIWEAGQYDNSATDQYTLDRSYQARTSTVLGPATLDDNDGIMVFSDRKWNWLSMNVTTASVHSVNTISAVSYTNEDGDGFITPAAGQAIQDTLTVSSELGTGEQLFVWNPPRDWGKIRDLGLGDKPSAPGSSTPSLGGNFPVGKYGFRLQFTTSPDTTDPAVTGIELGYLRISGEELADNGLFENEITNITDFDADGVVAYYEVAAAGNMGEVEVQCIG